MRFALRLAGFGVFLFAAFISNVSFARDHTLIANDPIRARLLTLGKRGLTVALAQEKPDAPKPKHDRKIFIVGTALLAAAKTADAITTRQLLDRGGWENDPIFGRHPSPAKQSLINLGIFGAQAGVFYLKERSGHAWVRWAGRAVVKRGSSTSSSGPQ